MQTGTAQYERIVANYVAQCARNKAVVNRQLLDYIEYQLRTRSIELDLTSVPVIARDAAVHKEAGMIQCASILGALAYDTYFRCLNVSGGTHASTVRALARYLRHNKTVTKLVARSLGAQDEALAPVLHCLGSNAESAVQLLDLSGNVFGVRALAQLDAMLTQWNHPLTELVLADCGLNGKMLQTLFGALNKNPVMSMSIAHLDLSGNRFELVGTQALDSWFAKMMVYCDVKKLVLRNTGVVVGALKYFHHIARIEELDLSGNRIDAAAVAVLTPLVSKGASLRRLVLQDCSLVADAAVLGELLRCVEDNKKAPLLALSLASNNDLAKGVCGALGGCAARLCELDLSGVRMREQHFAELAALLAGFTALRTLDLSGSAEKLRSPAGAVSSLLAVVDNGLLDLRLADSVGKQALSLFFARLPPTCLLQRVDVSNNQLGDDGLAAVAAWLAGAQNIRSVNVDDNRATHNGLLVLCSALASNKSLTELRVQNDMLRELGAATGLARKRLAQALTRMELSLHANDADQQPFWVTNSDTLLDGATPMQLGELPAAPQYFTQGPGAAADAAGSGSSGAGAVGGLTTMQVSANDLDRVPEITTHKVSRHKPIIASRVQSSGLVSPSAGSGPGSPDLKAPPMLSLPGHAQAPQLLAPSQQSQQQPPELTTSGREQINSAGVARRTTAKRMQHRSTPSAITPRSAVVTPRAMQPQARASHNFDPTAELKREEQQQHEEEDPEVEAEGEEPPPLLPVRKPPAVARGVELPQPPPKPVPRTRPQTAPATAPRPTPPPKPVGNTAGGPPQKPIPTPEGRRPVPPPRK